MKTQFVIPVIVSILILGTLGLTQDVFATHTSDYTCTYVDAKKFNLIICPQTPQVGDVLGLRNAPSFFLDCDALVVLSTPETDRTGSAGIQPIHGDGPTCTRIFQFVDYQVVGKPSR